MSIRAPAAASRTLGELLLLLTLGTLWLGSWMILTLASCVAGGHPSASPVDYINPGRVIAHLRADRGLVAWDLVDSGPRTQPAIFWCTATVFSLMLVSGGLLVTHRARWPSPARLGAAGSSVRGVSRWARGRDLRGLRVRRCRSGRFSLGRSAGRHIATERETSVLVVGPTRSGKTTCLVVPNLLDWRGPAVVTSTKGELLALTAAQRQRVGPVHIYDPTGELGMASVTWSPVAGCHDLDRAWMVAAWLCAGLQQGVSRGDNDWAHWAESGKLLIAPLLFTAANTGCTVVDVHSWIHGFDLVTPAAMLEELAQDPATSAFHDAQRALSMLTSIDQRPERERGTVFSTVMRIFSAFNERAVAASAATSRFDPRALLERCGTLYLCTPRMAAERVASLFVGILMTVVIEAYGLAESSPRGRLPLELGLFLDELANVVPIDDLPSLASQGAGRGVLLMSIVQDLSQLRARYGTDRANTILNNHPCKVILPGVSDPETVEVLSRLIGRRAVTDVQVSRGGDGRVSRSYTLRHDSLATPDALRQLDASCAVAVYRGRPPIVLRLRPWYQSRHHRGLVAKRFFRAAEQVSVPNR